MTDQQLDPEISRFVNAPRAGAVEELFDLFDGFIFLLRHNFLRRTCLSIGVAQQGHRDKVATTATINLLRIVAIEFGTWRSVLSGGASGSVTVGNGRFLEQRGGTRS